MFRTILFALGAASIGYVLYLFFYWRQMHALVPFLNGNLDAPVKVAGLLKQNVLISLECNVIDKDHCINGSFVLK